MKRSIGLLAVLAALLASFGLFMSVRAHDAIGPETLVAGFEVDHDQTAGTHGLSGDDWDTVITAGTAGFNDVDCRGTTFSTDSDLTFLLCDDHSQGSAQDRSVFAESDKVFDLEYDIKCGGTPKKDDQANIYFTLREDASGDIHMIAGQERLDVNGSSHINFVLIRNSQPQDFPVCPHGDVFVPLVRTEGDVLVAVDYEGGGTEPEVRMFIWDTAPLGVGTTGGPRFETDDDCPNNGIVDPGGPNEGCWNEDTTLTGVVATVNFDGVDGGSISLSDPEDVDDEIVAEFPSVVCERVTGGNTPHCEIKPNIPQRGFVEISVDLTANDLAPGCEGFGTLWTETRASHSLLAQLKDVSDLKSVELECSIEITKDGPPLSKIGDDVTYDIQVCNTSSSDSPDLNLVSITDTKLGNLAAAATAAGCDVLDSDPSETCSFDVLHTIPGGASDPYLNEVTATYQVDGFENQYTRSDDHSVNLFTASLTLDKDCQPQTAALGDTITYTFTITNTSSLDAPNLIRDSVEDTLLGNITSSFPASLAPGQTVDVVLTRDVQAGDPDPLPNSVVAHYHPDGFSNDVWDDASCSVDLVGCALSPGFWKGGEGVRKWDQAADPIAAAAGFTTSTPFPWVAAGLADPTPGDGAITYLDVLNLPAGGDVTIQLAFKYIAAKLNQAAFGVPTSTADLLLEIEDYFDSGGVDNADSNLTDLYTQPVGSNPSGSAKSAGQDLKRQLDNYFRDVGEEFCPATGDIPEA